MGSLSNRKWPAERAERAETPSQKSARWIHQRYQAPEAGGVAPVRRAQYGRKPAETGGNRRKPAETPVSDGYPCIPGTGHGGCCKSAPTRPPPDARPETAS